MNPEEYAIMYRAEDHHWWYRGMERITRALLDRWYKPGAGLRILDAGCGTGAAMTSYLAEYGQVTGIDTAAEALKFSRMRGAPRLARASVLQLPFAGAVFDVVTSFDVLYERGVPDDVAALREFDRVLVPGGRTLLRLPAYDWLRGKHDEAVHARHRYTRNDIAARLRRAGLSVEHLSYANTFLFPVALVRRLAEKVWPPRSSESDLTMKVGPLGGLLAAVLSAEAPLVAGAALPFGLSVIAVARKGQASADDRFVADSGRVAGSISI
jgi:ubiquinone/menaquinone biosynthesis C-methylase UbiE